MKKTPLKKYSLLGIALAIASVVTASITHSKEEYTKTKFAQDGRLANGVDFGGQTCVPVSQNRNCHDTWSSIIFASSTTGASPDDSSDDDGQGAGGPDTNTTGQDNS